MDESEQQFRDAMRKADEQILALAKETGARRAIRVVLREGLNKELTALGYAGAIEAAMGEIVK